jgi:hypothetical protein
LTQSTLNIKAFVNDIIKKLLKLSERLHFQQNSNFCLQFI